MRAACASAKLVSFSWRPQGGCAPRGWRWSAGGASSAASTPPRPARCRLPARTACAGGGAVAPPRPAPRPCPSAPACSPRCRTPRPPCT
uniref:Uncharacterized protein n=1 Tax=Arundo donax TaxID=35708 RepID=A0A0A9FM62_ARUDO